jgi:periplasmic protein TonB
MKRDDYTGLGVSAAVHLLLLLVFALGASTPVPEPLGMIEVEIGPLERAEPPARAEVQRPAPQAVQPRPQPEPPAPRAQPQRQEPVNLARSRDTPQPERIRPPSPDPAPRTAPAQPQPQQPTAVPAEREQAGGTPTGAQGTTSETGDPGTAAATRAPFSIEGLDRTMHSGALPRNPGARGVSVIAVCVGPDGRVTSARPAQRTGTPALDNAALGAVRSWRFNALPPAAPQSEQCGRIRFDFTLG